MSGKQNGKKNYIIEAVIMLSIGITFLLVLIGVFGRSGKVVTDFLVGSLGYAVYGYCVGLILFAILKLCKFSPKLNIIKILCITLSVAMFLALLHVISSNRFVGNKTKYVDYLVSCYQNPVTAGGLIGGLFIYPILKLNYIFAVVLTALITLGGVGAVIFTQFDTKAFTKITKKGRKLELTDLDKIEGEQALNSVGDDLFIYNRDKDFKNRVRRTDVDYVPLDELNKDSQRQTLAKDILDNIPIADNYEEKRKSAINILFKENQETLEEKSYTEEKDNSEKSNRRNKLSDRFARHKDVEKFENNIDNNYDNIDKNNKRIQDELGVGKDYFDVENIVVNRKESYDTPQENIRNTNAYKPLIDNVLQDKDTSINDIWSQRSKERKDLSNNQDFTNSKENRKSYFDSIEKLNTHNKDADLKDIKKDTGTPSSFSSAIESLNGKISNADMNDEFDFNTNNDTSDSFDFDDFGKDTDISDKINKANNGEFDDFDVQKDFWDKSQADTSNVTELFGKKDVDNGAYNYDSVSDRKDISKQENFDINNNDVPFENNTVKDIFGEVTCSNDEDFYANDVDKITNDTNSKNSFGNNINFVDKSYEKVSRNYDADRNKNIVYGRENYENNAVKEVKNYVVGRKDDSGTVNIIRSSYKYPPTSLLKNHNEVKAIFSDTQRKIDVLERTLATFKIDAKVINTVQGPAFCRFELQMPQGVSVNKIKQYENDIAMCLEASSIRCQIPIPNKNAFGVEIPNDEVGTIGMKNIIESADFQKNNQLLSIVLGQDCDGDNYVVDLVSLNHVLIAGSTGSGKSVCLNTLICSLIYKHSPEDVRLILVDPKQIEFKDYDGIPHLLLPNILTTDKQCLNALDWLIVEMERRFAIIMKTPGAKNLKDYNSKLKAGEEKMPFIVAIIDEVGDIMLRAKKELEERVIRLTQKARASGIILVLATQRPSVDVITGTIKANLPSRIAFAVLSNVDSRTILDQVGAEKLIGKGDMLFLSRESPILQRIQGAFITGDEVIAISNYVKDNNDCYYDDEITRQILEGNKTTDNSIIINGQERNDRNEKLIVEASIFCAENNFASASMLQRKFNIGYNRAANIIEAMESLGYVSRETDAVKRRKMLVTREELLQIYNIKEYD